MSSRKTDAAHCKYEVGRKVYRHVRITSFRELFQSLTIITPNIIILNKQTPLRSALIPEFTDWGRDEGEDAKAPGDDGGGGEDRGGAEKIRVPALAAARREVESLLQTDWS